MTKKMDAAYLPLDAYGYAVMGRWVGWLAGGGRSLLVVVSGCLVSVAGVAGAVVVERCVLE